MCDLCEKCVVEVDRLPVLPEDPRRNIVQMIRPRLLKFPTKPLDANISLCRKCRDNVEALRDMVYAGAYVRVKRSSYTPHIIDEPALISAVRDTARRRFEEKDLTFKSFAKYKLIELLKKRVKAMESQEKRDREGNLLAFLPTDDLVSGSVEKLTVEVLKGAVVTWQQSNPHIFDLLRSNGTKEAWMRQFEELYGQ